MSFRRALQGVLLASVALGVSVACGPSFQAIYEGNARFEHCYALEERAQTPLVDKADCWHDWSERYTYGQTRDRIHYATARYVALSQVLPTDEALMMAAPGMTERTSTITAPVPTSALVPPPKVLDYPDASAGRPLRPSELPIIVAPQGAPHDTGEAPKPAPSAVREAPLPASDCVEGCGKTFRDCKSNACDKDYRACMRACMK